MSGWGAAVGAALGIGQSFITAEKERSASNAQRDWEKYMWDKQNAYNTPTAQKQRLIDAGLNPALMYQTMPQNVAQSPGSGSKANVPQFDIAGPVMNMIQAEQVKANTENVKADTERKWWDLTKDQQNTPIQRQGMQLDNQGKQINNEVQNIERNNREASLILKNKGLDLQNQQTQTFIKQMTPKFKMEMKKMLADIKNVNSQTNVNKGTLAVQKSTVDLNRMKTVLDDYERKARSEGWSYGDNILFRQISAAIGGLSNDAQNKTGGNGEGTSVYRAVYNLLDSLMSL